MNILRIVLNGEESPNYTNTLAFNEVFNKVDTVFWQSYSHHDLQNHIQNLLEKNKYDAVFMQLQAADIITTETAQKLAEHCVVFNWTGDVRNTLEYYTPIGQYCITLFSNINNIAEMQQKGFKSDFLQVAYDHIYYHNKDIERDDKIIWCANYYPRSNYPLTQYRLDAVMKLTQKYPTRFGLFGNGWGGANCVSWGILNNAREAEAYNKSLFAISISHYKYGKYFSDRLLREMACGCAVFSHKYPHCETDFKDGETIIYFDSLDDLCQKIDYYTAHKDIAYNIGKNAAQLVSKKYKWVNFAQNFKQLILKHKQQ